MHPMFRILITVAHSTEIQPGKLQLSQSSLLSRSIVLFRTDALILSFAVPDVSSKGSSSDDGEDLLLASLDSSLPIEEWSLPEGRASDTADFETGFASKTGITSDAALAILCATGLCFDFPLDLKDKFSINPEINSLKEVVLDGGEVEQLLCLFLGEVDCEDLLLDLANLKLDL